MGPIVKLLRENKAMIISVCCSISQKEDEIVVTDVSTSRYTAEGFRSPQHEVVASLEQEEVTFQGSYEQFVDEMQRLAEGKEVSMPNELRAARYKSSDGRITILDFYVQGVQ